jgi:LacI family transcriptional regulator
MMSLGHTRLGHLAGNWESARTNLVLAAVATSKESAATLEVEHVGPRRGDVSRALEELLSRQPQPTALFVHLQYLEEALTWLRARQIKIPQDLSLVSVGDAPWLPLVEPPIAAIHLDWEDLGTYAAKTMLAWLDGHRPRNELFATRAVFNCRGSLAPPRRPT